VATKSTNESLGVNRHTILCASSVFIVCNHCNVNWCLAEGSGSGHQSGTLWLWKDFTYCVSLTWCH